LVQGRDGAAFKTGGILVYFYNLKRGTNKDIGPKDIFEAASIKPGDRGRFTEKKQKK